MTDVCSCCGISLTTFNDKERLMDLLARMEGNHAKVAGLVLISEELFSEVLKELNDEEFE